MKLSTVVTAVALAVLVAGCVPSVVGAPCVSDQNCPSDQHCSADHTCQLAASDGGTTGGGGGTATGGGAATGGGTATGGDYTVAVTPPMDLNRSGSTDVTFTITRTGAFTGAVTLTLLSPPAGVSASPVMNTSGSTATMTLVTASAACGSLPLKVTASASGLADKLVDVPAKVALPNDLTLSLAASSLNVLRGGTVSTQGTLTRAACAPTDAALSTVTGLPSGVTVAITTGDSPAFTFSATAGAAPGKTTVLVKVTAGATVASQPVDLYVVQSVSGVVVGSLGFPASARVELPGVPASCVTTAADGTFSLSSASLASPYALRISLLNAAETCTSPATKPDTITYVDLTTLTPTLTLTNTFGNANPQGYSFPIDDLPTTCSAAPHDPAPTTDTIAVTVTGAQDFGYSYGYSSGSGSWLDPLGGTSTAPTWNWFGNEAARPGTIHYLRYTPAGGVPATYLGYRSVDLGTVSRITPPACAAGWGTDTIGTRPALTVTRSVPVLTSPSMISAAWAQLNDGAAFQLTPRSGATVAPAGSYVLPSLPTTFSLREWYHTNTATTMVSLAGASPEGALVVTLPALPTLNHSSAGCTGTTWCWAGPANSIFVTSLANTGCSCAVVSTRTSYTFTANECVPACLSATSWSVMGIAPYASVDAATAAPGGYFQEFVGAFGGLYGVPYFFIPPKKSTALSYNSGPP